MKGKKDSEKNLEVPKDLTSTFSDNPLKKKVRVSKSSNLPPGNLLTSNIISVEPISFAYSFDILDTTREAQLVVLDPVSPPPTLETPYEGPLVTFCPLSFYPFSPPTPILPNPFSLNLN